MLFQLANIVAFDPVNVLFAAMEFPLFDSTRARDYLRSENRYNP